MDRIKPDDPLRKVIGRAVEQDLAAAGRVARLRLGVGEHRARGITADSQLAAVLNLLRSAGVRTGGWEVTSAQEEEDADFRRSPAAGARGRRS